MNIYDTKIVRCSVCDRCIGEIRFDASVNSAKCGQCDEKHNIDKSKQQRPRALFAVPC